MWEPEAGRGSRCTFRERYGVSLRGGGDGGRGRERRRGGGGWVATVPCQALRGRLFIPWICIFCPLPFLTSYYPASMISSVGPSYCSRSSTRVLPYVCTVSSTVSIVCACVCVCVGGWMDVCTRIVSANSPGSSWLRVVVCSRAYVCSSRIRPRESPLFLSSSLSHSLSSLVRVYTFESCECTLGAR